MQPVPCLGLSDGILKVVRQVHGTQLEERYLRLRKVKKQQEYRPALVVSDACGLKVHVQSPQA